MDPFDLCSIESASSRPAAAGSVSGTVGGPLSESQVVGGPDWLDRVRWPRSGGCTLNRGLLKRLVRRGHPYVVDNNYARR